MKTNKMILDDFESFIKFRIGTGYAGYAMNYAKRYAQFLYSNYGNEEEVTEEMLQEYLKLHPHNNHNTYANAIAEIRTFSKYINQTGRKAYIPDKDYTYWKKRTEFIPYLLNDKELKMFFDHLDSYSDKDLYERRANRKVVFPILYRMMYCCGMRPQEVLNLKTIDVDLAFGDIYIRKTKSYRDRHIIMSSDMLDLCHRYMNLHVSLYHDYFFDKPDGKRYTSDDLYYCIKHFKKKTGFNKPNFRSYCFRHMFATENLIKWINNSEDITMLLPYLSVYMGHTDIRHTLYYIHLLPEHLRKAAKIDCDLFESIYPKWGYDI